MGTSYTIDAGNTTSASLSVPINPAQELTLGLEIEGAIVLMPMERYASICETASILNDADAMRAIRKSAKQSERGQTSPWEDVKRRLAL